MGIKFYLRYAVYIIVRFGASGFSKTCICKVNTLIRSNYIMNTELKFRINTEEQININLSLWQQICEDWNAHGRDWTKPGFRAVAVHRFGVWRMKVQPKILRAPLSILYRMLFRKIRNTYGIELPYSVKLGRRVIVEHQGSIVIHGNCEIGDDSIIRQGVTLGNRYLEHPFDAPKLGINVNVGAGAKIFGNVTIGDGANIGANAVVLSNVPNQATAVGIPAKIITNDIKTGK